MQTNKKKSTYKPNNNLLAESLNIGYKYLFVYLG